MTDPYLTETALVFHLPCAGQLRKFLIAFEALENLGRNDGFAMNHLNLYRAHEALIHVVARFLATEDNSGLALFIDVRHVAGARSASPRPPTIDCGDREAVPSSSHHA